MGVVTPDHVRLERNQPWPRNQFLRPYFVGAFEQKPEVILTGWFVEDRRTKFFVGTVVGAIFFGPSAFRSDVAWLSWLIEQAFTTVPDNALLPTAFDGQT